MSKKKRGHPKFNCLATSFGACPSGWLPACTLDLPTGTAVGVGSDGESEDQPLPSGFPKLYLALWRAALQVTVFSSVMCAVRGRWVQMQTANGE